MKKDYRDYFVTATSIRSIDIPEFCYRVKARDIIEAMRKLCTKFDIFPDDFTFSVSYCKDLIDLIK